jgi:dTDP-4-amino-4,6-dideoxygalactose transaminase
MGAAHAVGCAAGLRPAPGVARRRVKKGDEVITAVNTFIATTEAITHAGGTPVLVDVDEATQLIDPERVEAAITPRTRAIVPVHLYGQPADMASIRDIALRRRLRVVADAAQSHGAAIDGDRRKTLGDAAAFSFYPGKNLGAAGDAGAVMTDDERRRVHPRARRPRQQGEVPPPARAEYRRDDGSPSSTKLTTDTWIGCALRARRAATGRSKAPTIPIKAAPNRPTSPLLRGARARPRQDDGEAQGQGHRRGHHYPIPLHLQPAYSHLGLKKGSSRWRRGVPQIICCRCTPNSPTR